IVAVNLRKVRIVSGNREAAQLCEQILTHQHMIQYLVAAVEIVGILLIVRKRGDQIGEVRINQVRTGKHHLVHRHWMTENRAEHVDVAIAELKRVAIADGDNVLSRGLMQLQQVCQELSLLFAFGPDAGSSMLSRERRWFTTMVNGNEVSEPG